MSPTINRLLLGGVMLVQPAALRFTPRGTPYCRFTVQVDDSWGERPRRYPLHCILWGEIARELAPRLVHEARVTLEGRLSCSDWTDKEGKRRLDPEMVVEAVLFHTPGSTHPNTAPRAIKHAAALVSRPAARAPRPVAQTPLPAGAVPPALPRHVPIAADELPPF